MDHRQVLISLLQAHEDSPLCQPDERQSLNRTVHFVRSDPNCFERSNHLGHITGSAWVLNAEGTAVLLLHHRKLNRWLQPGGHADGDGDIRGVALREVQEETGLSHLHALGECLFDVDVHAIPARPLKAGRKTEGAHFHYDIRFAFRAPIGAQPIMNDESNAVLWISRNELIQYTQERSVLRMLDKWDICLSL